MGLEKVFLSGAHFTAHHERPIKWRRESTLAQLKPMDPQRQPKPETRHQTRPKRHTQSLKWRAKFETSVTNFSEHHKLERLK